MRHTRGCRTSDPSAGHRRTQASSKITAAGAPWSINISAEGQAHEYGDLFLSTHADDRLLVPGKAGHAGDFQVFVDADFCAGEKHLQVGLDSIDDRGEVAFSGFALSGAQRVGEEVENLEFSFKTVASTRRLFEFVLGVLGFVNASVSWTSIR